MADEEGSILDDSPIEQVRLTVPPTDDNTLQVLTFRTWLIGIPICILGSVIAALSSYRQQLFYLSQVCINIIVLIIGKLMANMLPNKVVRMPYTNWGFSLNPGPYNFKECGDHHTGRHGKCFCWLRNFIHVQDLLPQGYPIIAGHAAGAIDSVFASITCSSCSTRPDGLLDIRGINTFSPHAHLTTNDQFLLLRRGDVCKGLIHVELLPWDIQVIQVPLLLVAHNASQSGRHHLLCYSTTKPASTQGKLPYDSDDTNTIYPDRCTQKSDFSSLSNPFLVVFLEAIEVCPVVFYYPKN
ncbi:uncharacterized protein LOC135675559 [Musa acuminata AAA Group]|uniref:uncharacterized protein LOC135675559 n=1 Tax=Musa acuminata AAA Group TaxID=214697 RepID=UPI0031D09118